MSSPAPLPCLEPLEARLAPAGLVTITSSGNTLILTGDSGDNNIEINDNGDGTWTIRDMGEMGTLFRQGSQTQAMADTIVTAPTHLKVNLQGGNDNLSLDGLRITGSVTITDTAAEGNDTVLFDRTVISGAVKVNLGGGQDTLTTRDVTFGSLLTLQGGAGIDTYNLGGGSYTGIKADLGTGSDIFHLRSLEDAIIVRGNVDIVSKSTAGEALTFLFGASNLTITGKVAMKIGEGSSSLVFSAHYQGQFHVLGGFSYTGGKGDDGFHLGHHILIGGRLDIKTGEGTTSLATGGLSTLTVGSLNFTGGSGADNLEFTQGRIQILGDATFNLANGANELRVTYGQVDLSIGGKFTYKGGTGSDQLTLNGSRLQIVGALNVTSGNGINSFEMINPEAFVGAITYIGGTGHDTFQLGNYTGTVGTTHVFGHITATLGAGKSHAYISDAHVHGNVRLTSATDDTSHIRGSEHLGIRDSIITGTTQIKATGTSGTTAALHSSIFQGSVTIETGRGRDEVILDDSISNFPMDGRKNHFRSAVRILLGAGGDVLNLHASNPAIFGNIFDSTFFADGGAGKPINGDHNILFGIPSSGNVFSTPPTLKNFEPVV